MLKYNIVDLYWKNLIEIPRLISEMKNAGNKSNTFLSMRTFYALRSDKVFLINSAQENVKMLVSSSEIYRCRSSFLEKNIKRLLQPNYLARII
jgi:hypothetical protein